MRTLASVAILALALTIPAVAGDGHHVKVDLVPNGASGVTGFVQITQLPQGGSNVTVHVKGLQPGTEYASFYYESADCSEPADLLQAFTADTRGNGRAAGKIDEDLDEVGSVSVRIGPGYGDLLACAVVHPKQ